MSIKRLVKPEEAEKKPSIPLSRCCRNSIVTGYLHLVRSVLVPERELEFISGGKIHRKKFPAHTEWAYPEVAQFPMCCVCRQPVGSVRIGSEFKDRFNAVIWLRLTQSKNFYVELGPDGNLIEYDWNKHPFIKRLKERGAAGTKSLQDALKMGSIGKPPTRGAAEISRLAMPIEVAEDAGDAQEPGDSPNDQSEDDDGGGVQEYDREEPF